MAVKFLSDVTVGSSGSSSDKTLNILTGGNKSSVKLMEAGTVYGFSAVYDGVTNKFQINRHNNSAVGTPVLSLNRDDDNATFAGDITTSDGDVGIGTDDPEKKLHVKTNTSNATPQVLVENEGTGDASMLLNVSGQSYVFGIDYDDSKKFKIASSTNLGTTDRITLLSSGNVGIGTITPSQKLEVDGNIKADSFIKEGGDSDEYLMADGSTSTGGVSANNSLVTINTDTGLDGATTFTLNQATDKVIDLSLDFTELPGSSEVDALVGINDNGEIQIPNQSFWALNRGKFYITGDGTETSFTFTHTLSYSLVIQVYDTYPSSVYKDEQVYPTIKTLTYNTFSIHFKKPVPVGHTYSVLAIMVENGPA